MYLKKEGSLFFFCTFPLVVAYYLLGGDDVTKDNFIKFVKINPGLVDYVKKNNVSWQSLYEVYSLYGEDESVWSRYLNDRDSSINELVNLIKGVNLESVRKVVDGLQRTISLVQEIGGTKSEVEEPYQKSPSYEDLDD